MGAPRAGDNDVATAPRALRSADQGEGDMHKRILNLAAALRAVSRGARWGQLSRPRSGIDH